MLCPADMLGVTCAIRIGPRGYGVGQQLRSSAVILSEVSRAFGFARSAGTRKEGLPGRRLVEPGRSTNLSSM